VIGDPSRFRLTRKVVVIERMLTTLVSSCAKTDKSCLLLTDKARAKDKTYI
jgi:hypothetical protein